MGAARDPEDRSELPVHLRLMMLELELMLLRRRVMEMAAAILKLDPKAEIARLQ